jgi:hypothetical protein
MLIHTGTVWQIWQKSPLRMGAGVAHSLWPVCSGRVSECLVSRLGSPLVQHQVGDIRSDLQRRWRVRSTNFEIQNSKQARMTRIPMSQTAPSTSADARGNRASGLSRISTFGFRIGCLRDAGGVYFGTTEGGRGSPRREGPSRPVRFSLVSPAARGILAGRRNNTVGGDRSEFHLRTALFAGGWGIASRFDIRRGRLCACPIISYGVARAQNAAFGAPGCIGAFGVSCSDA